MPVAGEVAWVTYPISHTVFTSASLLQGGSFQRSSSYRIVRISVSTISFTFFFLKMVEHLANISNLIFYLAAGNCRQWQCILISNLCENIVFMVEVWHSSSGGRWIWVLRLDDVSKIAVKWNPCFVLGDNMCVCFWQVNSFGDKWKCRGKTVFKIDLWTLNTIGEREREKDGCCKQAQAHGVNEFKWKSWL